MLRGLDPPLVARKGRELKVLAVCRISTVHQDEKSLEDQEALYRRWLSDHTELPHQITVLTSRGSGECLVRQEYLQLMDLIESRQYDLVISEDLGRICRRVHAHIVCETCEDHQVRLIALNDFIDTFREEWRTNSFIAVMRHEAYNADTAKRIRRSHRNRFAQGGVVQTVIFGYIKPENCKSDADLKKDPAAERIYEEWFRRLEDGARYSEVADWLNAEGVLPGPYSRISHWTPQMVMRITHNPILKGVRRRNERMSRRINSTGRRRSIKAPASERLERVCPHLAFIEPARFDHIIAALDAKNAVYRRGRKHAYDVRQGVPRKRTIWPGQSIHCGVCGRLLYYSVSKGRRMFLCSGAQHYRCWNSVMLDAMDTSNRICRAIWAELEQVAGFDDSLLLAAQEQLKQQHGANLARNDDLERQLAQVAREEQNLVKAVSAGHDLQPLLDELRRVQQLRSQLTHDLEQLRRNVDASLPTISWAQLKQEAGSIFNELASDTPEFSRAMNRLIQKLQVFPYRLCDGGAIVLRAEFELVLANLLPTFAGQSIEILRRPLRINLFDPTQREQMRPSILELTAQGGLTERQIAAQLGVTQPVVQRAKKLARQMASLGLADPYVRVTDPPEEYGKLRRHKHPRFRFEPLDRS